MHPIHVVQNQIEELKSSIALLDEFNPFTEATYDEYITKIKKLETKLKILNQIQKETVAFTNHFGVIATWLDEMVIVYIDSTLYTEAKQFLENRLDSQGKRIGYFSDERAFEDGKYDIKILFKLNEITVAQGDIEIIYYH